MDAFSEMLSMGADREPSDESNVESEFPTEKILENPWQPRTKIDDSYIDELAESIRSHGVLQAIIVRDSVDKPGYKVLIAGQCRLLATRKAGLSTIPIVTKVVTESAAAIISIVENMQREDLSPLENALSLKALKDEFKLSQKEIGDAVGKSNKFVSDHMQIFKLPEVIYNALEQGKIESAQTASELRKVFAIDEEACLAMLADNEGVSYHDAVSLHRRLKDSPDEDITERETETVGGDDYELESYEDSSEGNEGYVDSDRVEEVSYSEEGDYEESKEFQHKVSIVKEILENFKGADNQDIAETIVSKLG